MSFYPEPINKRFLDPLNVGEVEAPDGVGDTGSLLCGAALRLTFSVDDLTGKINQARFRAAGCGYVIASASLLTEILRDITAGDAAGIPAMLESILHEEFGEFPCERAHCATLCRDALSIAINAYRAASSTEFLGEEALICTCFGVSESSIERAIETNDLKEIAEVTKACRAGGGCRSCHPLIEDILDDFWRTKNAFVSNP